ncbi:MAG TPA: ATP-binding protein [Gammaproteobacteria bacterium]|jgi:signal transduction histidine kinase|nr:ATP-binding protein [Gammaproteobacteria bacterium]
MRLWPGSLYGRLVIVFISSLLLAQVIGIVVSSREASRALVTLNNTQWVQRVSETATLLESEGDAERLRVATVLSGVRLKVQLEAQMPPVPTQSLSLDDSTVELQGLLEPALAGRSTHIYLEKRELAGIHRVVDVQLHDGSWVRFDYLRPPSLSQWPYPLLLESLVLSIAIVLVSLFAMRWVTRPLSTLARAADELGVDLNRPPLPEEGPVEVRAATAAFNNMQARLRDYIYERTRILTAVSHDLRTPITRLRLRAELLADEELKAKLVRDLQEMENMTNATLSFLRGFEDREMLQSVDLMALLESLETDSVDTGYDVQLLGRIQRPIMLRPRALRRLLDNLVTNAIRYGKRAIVTVEDLGSEVVIRVRDAGTGIPPQELEKVFEPYYRLETARSQDGGGTGLGLSIARNIAELHGGTLILQNHPAGGLEAILTLPIRD